MKKRVSALIALLLTAVFLFSACQVTEKDPSSSAPSQEPSSQTSIFDRPLPTLPEKFVKTEAVAGAFPVTVDGKAEAKIVVPAARPEKTMKAAEDLCKYIERITGVRLEIVNDDVANSEEYLISLGETTFFKESGITPFAAYPDDERYVIKRKGDLLFLCGNDDGTFTGTQFAVTKFLEEAGCGWFSPDPLWEVVPEHKTLSVVAVDLEKTARFSTRRLSGNHVIGGNRWYLGGQQNSVGHGVTNLVPKEFYYESNPEWFALTEGSRDPSRFRYWQYCYTNKELAAKVAEEILLRFDYAPYLTNYSIAANDGWNEHWCECETCEAAGSDTDELLIFANNVAEIVCEKYPDRQISILAYHSTYLPPVSNVKAHPNVEVMFCLETSPFVDLQKGELIHEGYNAITRVTYTQPWKKSVADYIQKTGLQHKAIWGWYCIKGTRQGWDMAPWVQGNVISNNMDLFEEIGVDDIFYDASYGEDPALRWPLWYPISVCMFDGEKDAETLLYDACLKLYGAAAEDMFLYYRTLADAAEACTAPSAITWVAPYLYETYWEYDQYVDVHFMAARAKLDELTPEQRERVENQLHYWAVTKMGL